MSIERLHEHRRLWAAKPVLARVYEPWFDALLAEAPRGARVLEVGAGPGFLRPAPASGGPDLRWIASDLHPLPWNALAADAGRLPLCGRQRAGRRRPRRAAPLRPTRRRSSPRPRACSAPGGRLALVEPWITPLSWLVYRFFHQEDCRLSVDPWQPVPARRKDSFDGDAAVPWQLVARHAAASAGARSASQPPRVRRVNAFAYLLSARLPARVAAARCRSPPRRWRSTARRLRSLPLARRLRAAARAGRRASDRGRGLSQRFRA